jgi:hypothetical protein
MGYERQKARDNLRDKSMQPLANAGAYPFLEDISRISGDKFISGFNVLGVKSLISLISPLATLRGSP